jgi:hypothetical protein
MNDGTYLDWYDFAWLCSDSSINLGVVERDQCPKESREGTGRYVREDSKHVSLSTPDRTNELVRDSKEIV